MYNRLARFGVTQETDTPSAKDETERARCAPKFTQDLRAAVNRVGNAPGHCQDHGGARRLGGRRDGEEGGRSRGGGGSAEWLGRDAGRGARLRRRSLGVVLPDDKLLTSDPQYCFEHKNDFYFAAAP